MNHRILVPFELPDAEPLPSALVSDLGSMAVVVLGHYGLPEQTPPEAARTQFEAGAQAELDDLARPFREAGASVTTRLVFGKTRAKTIDRVAVDENCDVVLTTGRADRIERVLVALRGETNLEKILSFVGDLLGEGDASVTLFHAIADGEDYREGQSLLDAAADRLVDAGIDRDRIDRRLTEGGDARAKIVEFGGAFDVLVLGESEPSIRERIIGDLLSRITGETDDPAFVVRNVD